MEKKEYFDFDPMLESNAYLKGVYSVLKWQRHHKTWVLYTDYLNEYLVRIKSKSQSKKKPSIDVAMDRIKYYVTLYQKKVGDPKASSDKFWAALMPPDIWNKEWVIIQSKSNPHFPDYLRRRGIMSLIEKLARSAAEINAEKTSAEVANALEQKQPKQGIQLTLVDELGETESTVEEKPSIQEKKNPQKNEEKPSSKSEAGKQLSIFDESDESDDADEYLPPHDESDLPPDRPRTSKERQERYKRSWLNRSAPTDKKHSPKNFRAHDESPFD